MPHPVVSASQVPSPLILTADESPFTDEEKKAQRLTGLPAKSHN